MRACVRACVRVRVRVRVCVRARARARASVFLSVYVSVSVHRVPFSMTIILRPWTYKKMIPTCMQVHACNVRLSGKRSEKAWRRTEGRAKGQKAVPLLHLSRFNTDLSPKEIPSGTSSSGGGRAKRETCTRLLPSELVCIKMGGGMIHFKFLTSLGDLGTTQTVSGIAVNDSVNEPRRPRLRER